MGALDDRLQGGRRRGGDRGRWLLRLACIVTVALPCPLRAGEDCPPADRAAAGSAAAVASGMRVHVDPATGEFVPPPPELPSAPPVVQPLREEPVPGGGVMVDTRGRLLHSVTGAVEPGGGGTIGCTTAPPADRPAESAP
jgi:hypothetical protein